MRGWLGGLAAMGLWLAPAVASDVNRSIAMDMSTDWQPLGGAFRFSVTPALDANAAKPRALLCPHELDESFFDASGALSAPANAPAKAKRLAAACEELTVEALPAETATPEVSKFQATLSSQLPDGFVAQSDTYLAGLDLDATNALFRRLITGASLQVRVDAQTTHWFRVGLTWRLFVAAATLAVLLALGWTLARFAKSQRVPGPGNPKAVNLASLPIRLISSDGRASLSQFQIILWTFVVLGGAIFVVLLNGALIPISSGTLVLLGISGVTGVISQVKENQPTQAPTPTPKPGPVQDVKLQTFADSSDILVKWSPPDDAVPITQYRIGYRKIAAPPQGDPAQENAQAQGAQQNAAPQGQGENGYDAVVVSREAGVRLVGMDDNGRYIVGVSAENGAGQSAWVEATGPAADKSTTVGPTEAPAGKEASAVPPANLGVPLDKTTANTITLEWDPLPGGHGYDVQVRRADSREDWSDAILGKQAAPPDPGQRVSRTAFGLVSGVAYNFRVRRANGGSPWSSPVRARTLHQPSWADLVTEPDRPNEIEVTRVQMLLFTIVTAGFVVLKIADTGIIPEIPQEYLVLMGISNSVYLSGKWARR